MSRRRLYDNRGFPNLYPGLHLLPNHAIFYSRTGWGSAGAGGSATADNRSAYFTFTGPNTGTWTPITNAMTNRAKGMSLTLLSNTAPYVRVLALGGVDNATNNTYEILDASVLSPSSAWSAPMAFPDGEHRSLCSGVLLPDGNVFVCGGIQRTNSPCTLFNPQANTWSGMAALPSIRDYHSVALLLPSGKVMMAGWNNSSIEIFSPPYLYRGARPVISSAPALVHHGQSFVIESPDADSIVKVVLVRPMAVTHQTDSEQKILEMPYIHDHARPTRLALTAPHGGHPHSLAQQGYYMMFAINNNGVPSVAKWIYLH
ncbi:MAG TPA: galactose oxidase-like domain-containing protein [Acidiferrobacterales bacterium]